LYLSLKAHGKNVVIASPTEVIVELSSLVGIDKVATALSGEKGDLTVSFPYQDGEIEKVSYTLENGSLNIIVKAGVNGLSFSEKDVQYKRGTGPIEVLFVIGTPRLSDLGNLFDPEALKSTTVINIDNKTENQGFGEIALVSPASSSVSEQIASLVFSLSLPLELDIAQNLMSGIMFGTDNFQSPKTSVLAFEMAAELLKKGAARQTRQKPKQQFQDAFSQFGQPKAPQRTDFPAQNRDARGFRPRPVGQQPQFNRGQQQQPRFAPAQNFPSRQVSPQFVDQKETQKEDENQETPPDWLTPKVYKGSTLV